MRSEETHLVILTEALFPGEHPELALAAVRRRLFAGEQAVTDRSARAAIRVVLPQKLQLRGGRTVVTGASDEPRGRINPGLVTALKRAHADLIPLKASPFTRPDDLALATSPVTQHDRQVCRLAYMSPDIQRQILTGLQPRGLQLRQLLKAPMPLAWADQNAWLEALSSD